MTQSVLPTPAPRTLAPRWVALAVALAALVGVGAAALVHHELAAPPALALPTLHGEVVWSPGERPAPGFALRDQAGAAVSLRAERGRTVVLAFLATRCGRCAQTAQAIGQTVATLPAALRPQVLVVGAPGDGPASARAAVRRWQLPAGSRWLTGPAAALLRVRRAYGIPAAAVGRALYLLDPRGDERTGYLAPFLPGFVADDLRALAEGK